MSRGRALSLAKPGAGSGLKDAKQQNAAIRITDRMQKRAGKMARKGEGDRHIPVRRQMLCQHMLDSNVLIRLARSNLHSDNVMWVVSIAGSQTKAPVLWKARVSWFPVWLYP